MSWENVSLDQLKKIHEALGAYIGIREAVEQQEQLERLKTDRSTLELELREIRAQLAAQEELTIRLREVLKLSDVPNTPVALNGRQPANQDIGGGLESLGEFGFSL